MPAAPVRQCAILVGGLGTRLGGLTATLPKPLLRCGDRPFLAWLLRELTRYGIDDVLLLTGYLSNVVEAAMPEIVARLPKHVRITCCTEPVRAGTGGALYHARNHLADRFMLCNGDSLLDSNLSRLFSDATGDSKAVTGWIALRRLEDTSRYGLAKLQGDRITAFQEPEAGRPGVINAGVYLLDRGILDDVKSVCSLERDVLPALASRGVLRGTVVDGYFIDIGIVTDLERAQLELPARLHRPALFLAGDSVIDNSPESNDTFANSSLIPGAIETIAAANHAGFHVFIIAKISDSRAASHTEGQLTDLRDRLIREIRAAGGTLDDVRASPYHQDDAAQATDWRNLSLAMLLDLMSKWEVDPSGSLFIGQHPDDVGAAATAGLSSHRFDGTNLATIAFPLLNSNQLTD